MRWSFNIVALARVVLGRAAFDGWDAAVEPMLREAYQAKDGAELLYGEAGQASLLELIDGVRRAVTAPMPLERLLRERAARVLSDAVGGEDVVARLLPYVVPVDGHDLAPPGAGTADVPRRHPRAIGSYAELPALDLEGISWRDPRQGALADCWLIASMIAIAWSRPNLWRKCLAATRRAHGFVFTSHVPPEWRHGAGDTSSVELTSKVPLDRHHALLYAHATDPREAWPALVEKAVVMDQRSLRREPGVRDYLAMDHLWFPQDAMYRLLGGQRGQIGAGDRTLTEQLRRTTCTAGEMVAFPTVAQTRPLRGGPLAEHGLVPDHAYAVLGVIDRDGTHVVLRNPFGTNPPGAGRASGAPWGAPRLDKEPSAVELDVNGVIAVESAAFDACFESLAWIEVAPDPPGFA